MREALEAKLKLYKESFFENREFNAWVRESDLWMAEYSILRVCGIELGKQQLVDILSGKLMQDIPLDIYSFVHSFKELYKDMQASVGMQESLNARLLERFHGMMFGSEGYRLDNPIIYKWGYIAPHFREIPEKLSELFKSLEHIKDPIDKAVAAHNGIAAIYPYGEDSAALAVAALIYELMYAAIPVPAFTADTEDYNRLMKAYLDKGSSDLADMFYSSLLNRLDSVMIFGLESMER